MDAVGAADAGGLLEFERAALQDGEELLEVLLQDGVRLPEQVTIGSVHDVGGGESVMDPFALGAEALADGPGEGDHVVTGDLLDLLDAVHAEGGGGADLVHVLPGDDAKLAPGFTGKDFDFEVGSELVLFGPDVPHHFTGIALDHRLFRKVMTFFSIRAARSSSSAFTKGTPVMRSYSSM